MVAFNSYGLFSHQLLYNLSISFISESLRYFPSDIDEKFSISSSLITVGNTDEIPFFDKIKFTQMLFDDDAGHLNFDALQYILRNIKRYAQRHF